MQSAKIVVKNLYKVFGGKSADVMRMLKSGEHKDEIFKKTGSVVGVNDVSFAVEEGEIFVLMGLSGSGKSTLIRLINRLMDPTDGQIILDGQDITKLTPKQMVELRRRDMSMVFQSFALMPHRSVLDNAAFGLEISGVDRKTREARGMEVLEQVGLAPFAHKYPHELSGGMQQRVGLVRALAVNPSLMLMDEAFSALDPLKRSEMQDILLDLQREQRRTIFFVSHDLEEALRIGTRIAIMEGGRLVQVGTPQQIIENPADDYVRNFFKSVDTSRYLQAKDLIEVANPPHSGRPGLHVPPSCSLPDVLQQLLGQSEPLQVRDDQGQCLGLITPSSVLSKISQHRLQSTATH
ncbi:glycine betaine/L-proline ABC transporter ATP-binding protein [Aquitalea sp. FJL05]|jgi:glycine betaine/proline transport system ATP-binding protein|uniref:quaternary amine ABC transporter ATP-binding protein n=1 Tax=Aquitalea TaxID=407217 RepID=UPI000F595C31|nr:MULTISPECIES: glycine betaine/L-proline ABC transporter ATP-binding protein [Aquitalea]RQO76942.1 glycine betaine/L-proline ABC transporter ATP-binding protein [Aquitalea sp. FJL05]